MQERTFTLVPDGSDPLKRDVVLATAALAVIAVLLNLVLGEGILGATGVVMFVAAEGLLLALYTLVSSQRRRDWRSAAENRAVVGEQALSLRIWGVERIYGHTEPWELFHRDRPDGSAGINISFWEPVECPPLWKKSLFLYWFWAPRSRSVEFRVEDGQGFIDAMAPHVTTLKLLS